jgi:hypothetical protein
LGDEFVKAEGFGGSINHRADAKYPDFLRDSILGLSEVYNTGYIQYFGCLIMLPLREMEGTWEELVQNADQFSGKRFKLISPAYSIGRVRWYMWQVIARNNGGFRYS